MPGFDDSRWATKPPSSTSTTGPAPASSGQPGGTNKHVSAPVFGYTPPSAPDSKPPPPRSAATTPSAVNEPPTPPHFTSKPFQRAKAAGKAAARRMDELQGDPNTFTKPFLYQNYGYPATQPNSSAHTAAPSAPARPSDTARPTETTRPTAETAEQKRARLHKLFNTWVPRADEFFNIHATLGLTAEELKAIQEEIVSYRVNSTMAAAKRTPHRAEWETAPAHLLPQREVESGAVDRNEDPLGLGLPRAVAEGRRIVRVENLLE